MRFKKRYILYFMCLLEGYLIGEMRNVSEPICPRCLCKVVPMTLYDRFTISPMDVKCNNCDYLFPLQPRWILHIRYWSYNNEALINDYNLYHN